MKKMPTSCPSCAQGLQVSEMRCPNCQTVVTGSYPLPLFLSLSSDDQAFILDFFLNSGSLKKMASDLGKSYPTVRNHLDDIIARIHLLKQPKA
ncbi:MAG: DUF2089 family protein [Bacteroidetes bacterium]|nr:DUF2089 family protein [Bacteroidota bacterium]